MCSSLCFESKLQQATKGFKVNLQLLQVSNTFLTILAVPNNAVFCTCPVLKLIPIFSIHLSNSFDAAPSVPITTGTTVTFFMPHMDATSLFKSPYFSLFFSIFRSYSRIPRHCYINDLAFLCIFIYHHHFRSSCFNFVIALDVEIPQYLGISLS